MIWIKIWIKIGYLDVFEVLAHMNCRSCLKDALRSTPRLEFRAKKTVWRCVTTQNSLESNRLHNIRLQEDSTRFVMKQFRNIFFASVTTLQATHGQGPSGQAALKVAGQNFGI